MAQYESSVTQVTDQYHFLSLFTDNIDLYRLVVYHRISTQSMDTNDNLNNVTKTDQIEQKQPPNFGQVGELDPYRNIKIGLVFCCDHFDDCACRNKKTLGCGFPHQQLNGVQNSLVTSDFLVLLEHCCIWMIQALRNPLTRICPVSAFKFYNVLIFCFWFVHKWLV